MKAWFDRLFRKESKYAPRHRSANDMRDVPVDNPLDFRPDGSIRPGDPAYDFFMELLNGDECTVVNQKKDGTWEVQK